MEKESGLNKLLEVISLSTCPYIVMLGEGKIGKILGDLFLLDNEVRFIQGGGYLVDDGYRKRSTYRNVPVWEMSEFLQNKNPDQYLCLNTVTSVENEKYLEKIHSKGFKHIIKANDSGLALEAALIYWKKYFEGHDIDIEQDELIIGKFIYPNPFLDTVTDDIRYAFATDVRDLIVTTWLNDYSQCDEGPYESEHVRIAEGDIVIDCGANIGISTSNAVARGCRKVYAIEPVLNQQLVKCQKLFQGKMEIHEIAFSDYIGKSCIYINPMAVNDNSLCHITNTVTVKKEVEVTTLDAFVEKEGIEKVDFIKLYIDDEKGRMIQGAQRTLKNYSPKLAIFPYCTGDIDRMAKEFGRLIQEINCKYKIEYNGNKMFAYV